MDRIWIALALLAVIAAGFAGILARLRRLNGWEAFAKEYLAKLVEYVKSGGRNQEAYTWLTYRSGRMQSQLGPRGIFAAYKPPFAQFQYTNYPVIVNMLPELKRSIENDILAEQADQYATTIRDTLVRYLGALDDQRTTYLSQIRNPIIWLKEGVQILFTLPFSLLTWTGLIGNRVLSVITNSVLFRVVSAIGSTIGLLSAIIGIVLGWDDFSDFVSRLWNQFFPE
jgi:hypothetical protein